MKIHRDFSDFLASHFQGKMQKLGVDAGFSCPNRDGTIGRGGCTYCNNHSFSPAYCRELEGVTAQIERGKQFFARKYPEMNYLAYFQAYTNTHSTDTDRLMGLYREALAVDGVKGIIVGTRPDCLDRDLLARLARLPWVMMEYGAESSHNTTLQRVNRCHTWEQTAEAVRITAEARIPVGLHLIMGLPGETEEDMLATIDRVNLLPVDTVKIHQLQLLRGTRMAADVESGLYDIPRFTPEQYALLCAKITRRLRSDIAIERFVSQAPSELLIYPRWGLKNYQFTHLVEKSLLSL
ncbi:MAG: TIGR01212 family radical SAM protein [Duncaniella sp.]|nr:TIGR01212 family radical SAM protein [Duncaniella sp.]